MRGPKRIRLASETQRAYGVGVIGLEKSSRQARTYMAVVSGQAGLSWCSRRIGIARDLDSSGVLPEEGGPLGGLL